MIKVLTIYLILGGLHIGESEFSCYVCDDCKNDMGLLQACTIVEEVKPPHIDNEDHLEELHTPQTTEGDLPHEIEVTKPPGPDDINPHEGSTKPPGPEDPNPPVESPHNQNNLTAENSDENLPESGENISDPPEGENSSDNGEMEPENQPEVGENVSEFVDEDSQQDEETAQPQFIPTKPPLTTPSNTKIENILRTQHRIDGHNNLRQENIFSCFIIQSKGNYGIKESRGCVRRHGTYEEICTRAFNTSKYDFCSLCEDSECNSATKMYATVFTLMCLIVLPKIL